MSPSRTPSSYVRHALVLAAAVAFACQESPVEPDPSLEPSLNLSAAATTIDLRLVRFDGASTSVLVSSGIPLPPGLLMPGATKNVTLLVNGKQQRINVRELYGRHPDGSLRSILLQARYPVAAAGTPAELEIGHARTTTDITFTPPVYGYAAPLPNAAALPTSAAYLVSTGIVFDAAVAPDAFSQTYESNFTSTATRNGARIRRCMARH